MHVLLENALQQYGMIPPTLKLSSGPVNIGIDLSSVESNKKSDSLPASSLSVDLLLPRVGRNGLRAELPARRAATTVNPGTKDLDLERVGLKRNLMCRGWTFPERIGLPQNLDFGSLVLWILSMWAGRTRATRSGARASDAHARMRPSLENGLRQTRAAGTLSST